MDAIEVTMTQDEARTLTDEVKADAAALWAKLLTLYEGGAHAALGYATWGDYYNAEFGQGSSYGYRLLDSARVLRALEAHSPIGERPAGETVARELAPLKSEPEKVADAWEETVQRHGPKPTARQTREVVAEKAPPRPRRPRQREDGAPLWENEDVLAWVGKRIGAGRSRDDIIRDARAGGHGWPLAGRHLPQNAADRALAILRDRRRRPEPTPTTPRKRSGKRQREVNGQRRAGTGGSLILIADKVVRMTSLLESIDIQAELLDDEGLIADVMRDLYDDLFELQNWMDHTTTLVTARLGEADILEKIRKLQNTDGRTDAEKENALRRIAQLRRRLEQRQLAAGV